MVISMNKKHIHFYKLKITKILMSIYSGYIPRKCSYTKQLITASDHASVQLSIKKENVKNDTDKKFLYVISGNLRKQGKSDGIINKLVEEDDMVWV